MFPYQPRAWGHGFGRGSPQFSGFPLCDARHHVTTPPSPIRPDGSCGMDHTVDGLRNPFRAAGIGKSRCPMINYQPSMICSAMVSKWCEMNLASVTLVDHPSDLAPLASQKVGRREPQRVTMCQTKGARKMVGFLLVSFSTKPLYCTYPHFGMFWKSSSKAPQTSPIVFGKENIFGVHRVTGFPTPKPPPETWGTPPLYKHYLPPPKEKHGIEPQNKHYVPLEGNAGAFCQWTRP